MGRGGRARSQARGGKIHMGTRLESLRWDDAARLWTIGVVTADGRVRRRSRRATSSPRRRSASWWRASTRSRPARQRADKLRYRDFLTVALIVDKPDLFPDNWIYIHEPQREGRPHPELPLLVAGDGAGREARLPRASNTSASRATGCGTRPTPS